MVLETLKEWSWLISLILSGILPLLALFLEHKFHLVNKLKKKFAIWFNKEAKIEIYLNYQTEEEFEETKKQFKDIFRKKGIKVLKSNDIEFVFNIDTYSISLTLDNFTREDKTISVDVERMASGIKSLKPKLDDVKGFLSEISKSNKKILASLESIEINIYLPYKWECFSLVTPKNFLIKEYNVKMGHINEHYKSEVKINMKNITITSNSWDAIDLIIHNFI